MTLNQILKKIFKLFIKPKLILSYSKKTIQILIEIFWVKKDIKKLKSAENILFVDLGSNLGQGFLWFSKYFNKKNIYFELFEPNPNCFKELIKLKSNSDKNIKIYNSGVGVKKGKYKFYGLDEKEGGIYSYGGSIIKNHNSKFFNHYENKNNIEVDIINFENYLIEKKKLFKTIIVKMDIEGAELDILEHLILTKNIKLINILYVEFHSQYLEKNLAKIEKMREKSIIKALKAQKSLSYRIWH